jgi:Na+-driven multidrug efflux pump
MRDGPGTLRFLIAALIIPLSAPQAFINGPVFVAARLLSGANDYSRILFACMISLCLALIFVLPALRWQRRQASIV